MISSFNAYFQSCAQSKSLVGIVKRKRRKIWLVTSKSLKVWQQRKAHAEITPTLDGECHPWSAAQRRHSSGWGESRLRDALSSVKFVGYFISD